MDSRPTGSEQPLLDGLSCGRPSPTSYGTTAANTSSESEGDKMDYLLDDALYPKDTYDEKVYWADLPVKQKRIFNRSQYRIEAQREIEEIKEMARQTWLGPVTYYMRNYAISGVGFLTEGYVLFSIGNILPLFKSTYPDCWKTYSICDERVIKSVKYMEIVGIIIGQIVVGYTGDALGRRQGLIQDAAIMLLGTSLLTAMWGSSFSGWTIMYVVAITVFGFGVGGEYPMTSTTSMEKFHGKSDRLHRGRSVLLAFLMQGWGQLLNQLALIVLMLLFNKSLHPPYSELATQAVFRIAFAFACIALIYFLYLRIFYLKGIDKAEDSASDKTSYSATIKLLIGHYWHRLLATSLCWFCSDFAFYGMQVFRNELLQLVTGAPSDDVSTLWLYNLINIGVQLSGYYMAAFFIDYRNYGRKRMQLVGFGAMFILFTIITAAFNSLNQAGSGAKTFQALFFLINFWVQFGPNSTTFLLAGEVFPRSVRATAHGCSAAAGKLGALLATVSFNYIDNRTKFAVSAIVTMIGFTLTIVFIPHTVGLNLAEQGRYWQAVEAGDPAEYHGIAVHSNHISLYEQIVLRRSDNYDSKRDSIARIGLLRQEYEDLKKMSGYEETATVPTNLDDNARKYFELEDNGSF